MRQITPDILLKAYALGVFPMAESRYDPTLYWVDPEERGVLPLDRFHIPHKIRRLIRRDQFTVRSNTAFRAVVDGCAEATPGRPSTWINDTVIHLYEQLFRMGRAHSVECWREGKLVGGLYGVSLGAAFFGESMFSREPAASQIALVHLVARLIAGDFKLLDTQFTTEHLKRFGVINISREDYHQRLSVALRNLGDFDALPESVTGETALRIVNSGAGPESRAT